MSARRSLSLAALAGALLATVAVIVSAGGESPYILRAEFADAAGLRKNSDVQLGGTSVGTVEALKITERDNAIVEMHIDRDASPVRRDARVAIRAANLLGEKFVEIAPGRAAALPSGSSIALQRTSTPVELDDILNVLDPDTRRMLSVLVNESGIALAGRGTDFNRILRELPPALDETAQLLGDLAADNRALGQMVETSDRVVAAIAAKRHDLGRFVAAAQGAFAATAARSNDLGQMVRRAPQAFSQLRTTLDKVETMAAALGPSAAALRSAAPSLAGLLEEVPPFSLAAIPTLDAARATAPRLTRLAVTAGPIIKRLRPAAGRLRRFADALDPASDSLASSIDDVLGVMEGWARAIQVRDGAGHMFRNQTNINPETLAALIERYVQGGGARSRRGGARRARPPAARGAPLPDAPKRPQSTSPKPGPVPGAPALPELPQLPRRLDDPAPPELPQLPRRHDDPAPLLDYLLGP